MKANLYKISVTTLAFSMLAFGHAFSNGRNGGEGGKGETLKKEESAEVQQEKKIEEPGLETMKSEGGLRQETATTKPVVVKQTTVTPVANKPIRDLAAERPEENASNSALSFNFVFYVMYKFNLSDI